MSIVIHGENISKDGTSQYVFKPTSKQVNSLNHLCYGRLDTPLRGVQFNFNCDQDLLAGCYIDYQTYSIGSKDDTTFTLQIDGVERLTFLRAFYSISQFYSYLQQSSKKQFIYQGYTFEQGFQYDETLLQQGYVSLSYYVQCISSTDLQWPVSRVNMDTQIIAGLQPGRPPYFGVVIHGENLIRMLGLDELSPNLQKYTLPYHDEHLDIDVRPLITSQSRGGRVYEYTINYYMGNITQNFLAFAPVWWLWQDYIEQPQQSITRDGVTYTVQTHYDWRNCFYIEGFKYKYSQWKNRERNEEFNPLIRYPDDLGLFQVYGTQAYFLQIYHYLLFHSPELAIENYVDERGKKYNIISKSINNTNPNQYFQMSTTEAIRNITLQNIASIEIHMNIYDQDFTLTKAYKQPLMILTFDRLREEETVLQDLRKTFDGTNITTTQVQ